MDLFLSLSSVVGIIAVIHSTQIAVCYGVDEEPDTGPLFTLGPPSNLLIYSHIGATVSCSALGKPMPEVYWERANGSSLPKYPNYMKIHTNDSLQFLPFSGPIISSIHRAAYRCVARNTIGKVVSRSVHVKTVKAEDYAEYNVYTQDVWVMKGNTAVFTCDIKPSFVRPYVNVIAWYIGDRQISNGEGTVIMDSSLYLTRVNEQDHMKQIKCITVNRMQPNLRKASRRATLRVINPVQTSPTIDYKKESITSKASFGGTETNVTLPCVAHAYPIARYTWSKGRASITPGGRFNIVGGDLHISGVQYADSGMYLCNASNVHGHFTVSTNLLITEPLSAKLMPKSQKIDASLPAQLHCIISGGPYNQVSWYKNGLPLPFHSNSNIRRINDTAIKIVSVSRRDVGMYQCLISSPNDNYQASSQLELGVSAPIFHDTLSTDEYKHPGDRVSLRCQVYGNPVPRVLWNVAGQPFNVSDSTGRVKIGLYMTAEGDIVSHVNISSLRVTDGGKYACLANNSIGEAKQLAQLNVYGIPVVRSMANRTAVANRTLRMECHVSGYPVTTTSWSKDGNALRMDHRLSIASGVLIINSVVDSDEGYYNCSASNSKNQGSSAKVYVSVITQPVLLPFTFLPLVQGDRHTATCQIKGGDLPIELSWYRNGQRITEYISSSLTVQTNPPYVSTLTFSSVQTSDIANYTCVARNKAGVVNSTAPLTTVNVKPYWVVKPNDSSVLLGSSILLPCKGAGIPLPSIVWKKAEDYSSRDFRVIGKEDAANYTVFTNGSLLVKDASLTEKGYFMCQLTNGVGPGKSQTVMLNVNVPAIYMVKRDSAEFLVGERVTLECDALGDHPLSTSWSKDIPGHIKSISISREGNSRIQLSDMETEGGMTSVLNIDEASRQDSGQYWCTCMNQFGKSQRAIKLAVRERPHTIEELTVTESKSRDVTLTWLLTDNGNSPIIQYVIQYSRLEVPWSSEFNSANSTRTIAAVSALQPATLYKFRVVAVNTVGRSNPSYEVVTTTAEERPAGPPMGVELQTLSCNSLNVSWLPPQEKLLHGKLQGYVITYKRINSTDDAYTLTVYEPTASSYTLIYLDTNSSYTVSVAAYNGKGRGPSSLPAIGFTYEDVPSHGPINVSTTVHQLTITVKWEKPELRYLYGKLLGYKIIIHSANERQDEKDQQIMTTPRTSITLSKLKVYTNYSIQVVAYTASGDGVRSAPVYCRTPPAPPGRPCQVQAAPVNSTSVLVSWLPPCIINGIVQQYQLTVHFGPDKVKVISISPPNLRTQALVTDLSQGQLYGFTVKAKNYQTVYGEASEEVTSSPQADVPPTFAVMEEKIDIGYHKSLVFSCPAVGDTHPSVSWTRGSEEILPKHFIALDNGTVMVERILKEDAGSYICTASNEHGQTSLSITLNVLDLPSAPILRTNMILASSLQVNWISANNGGFQLNGWSLEWGIGDAWEKVTIDDAKRSHWLKHLSCDQTYVIRMRAMNQEGASAFSNNIYAQTLGGKPQPPDGKVNINTVNKTSISLDLSGWNSIGCPIIYFSVVYKALSLDTSNKISSISSSQRLVYLNGLDPASWYNITVTAYNSAGSTAASFDVSTLTMDGSTIAPVNHLVTKEDEGHSRIVLLVTLSAVVVVILIISGGCFFFMKRRKQHLKYKDENKSRHSIFSDSSDLDNHHPARTPLKMPRENMSGDSRVWLLRNQTIAGVSEPEMVTHEKPDGEYETCTPTLTYARANLNKEAPEKCEHIYPQQRCHYCADLSAEHKQLLDVEDLSHFNNQFNKLQLKQYEVSFEPCDDEFPPPPPEALHEYHCEPIGKRCTSHEFMTHTGSCMTSRPNTTGLRQSRMDTPGRMSQYPSALSSMATVSSNQEELLIAYHNSKVNPLGPILFESPQHASSSMSPESSIATEPGIRMFTQSPPRPEESRQAVCEVPIYPNTLPSCRSVDPSSDTTTDQEPRSRHSRLKSPHRKLYKRKNKKSRPKLKSRDASDEMSTNSDDNFPYGIPNNGSSASDNGYGTKTKDTDDSLRTSSNNRARDCGDLYEEEETLSLVQTAAAAGETTPPSSLRNLNKMTENEDHITEDTKLIDRYYRTVSADNTDHKPVELYTDDYTIV